MRPSLRIPLTLTIIVVITGIIAFIKITAKGDTFTTNSFILWIIASGILIGITILAWQRNKRD